MPIDVHPAFQYIKDELEKAEAEGRKVEAKVIGTAPQPDPVVAEVQPETK